MSETPQEGATGGEEEREEEEEQRPPADEKQSGSRSKLKSKARAWLDQVFPQLTLFAGRETLSPKRSAMAVALLYFSHSFSAWGDRMWDFSVFLFLALLYPGSLLLPGVYGFVVQLAVAVFGTVVGDWVDLNPRMKVVWVSLLVQNGMVALCSVLLALMFALEWNVCLNLVIFSCLTVAIILLGSGAHLATVANTIAIERDWVVVLSDGNKDTLASLNANMRRIDLLCKLLAPAITGVFLQHTGPFATTLIVAGWNVASFFLELSLVWLVYRMVPPLAVKKMRKASSAMVAGLGKEENGTTEDIEKITGIEEEEEKEEEEDDNEGKAVKGSVGDEVHLVPLTKSRKKSHCFKCCHRLLNPLFTLKDGWRIFIRQEIMLVGFAMATIYLTVVGFSGVTSTYFLTQGLRGDLIGLFQGVGAIIGVAGTIVYPFIRKRVGTTRAGLFGISTQILLLLFCALAAVVPSRRISSESTGYYSADCSAFYNSSSSGNSTTSPSKQPWGYSEENASSSLTASCVLPTATVQSFDGSESSYGHITRVASSQFIERGVSGSATPTMVGSTASSVQPSATLTNLKQTSTTFSAQTVSSLADGLRSPSSSTAQLQSSPIPHCSPLPTLTPSQPQEVGGISVALVLMLIGVIGARFGLWIFDLAVSQLIQEKVVEEERGVVSGVMNAMNSIMDMLHYVLVIAAPRPEHFRILTLLSVAMVMVGWLFYAVFVRKMRGHFFHFSKFWKWCRMSGGGWRRRRRRREEEAQTSLVNANSLEDINAEEKNGS